jgi:predicted O-methyltransferase YrrM
VTEEGPAAAQRLIELATAEWVSRAVWAAAELGLADLMADGSRSADELARSCGAHTGALERLLRALVGVGVFRREADGRYGLTPLSEPMREGSPTTLRSLLRYVGGDNRRAWDEVLHTLATGRPAFERAFGASFFEHLTANPEAERLFADAMAERHRALDPVVAEAYDFTGVRTLVDVGGGHGFLAAAILRRNPGMRAILLDRPEVVAGAGPTLAAAGVADRVEVVGGDFFAGVPAGGDAYALGAVLYDWDDEQCVAILGNCRRAMGDGGRVLIAEIVIPTGDGPHYGKVLDLNIMVVFGGRARTEEEHRRVLGAAGLRLSRVIPTASRLSLVEAFRLGP